MARNEKTSKRVASIAARGLKNPSSLTQAEIKTLAASALTQAPDTMKKSKADEKTIQRDSNAGGLMTIDLYDKLTKTLDKIISSCVVQVDDNAVYSPQLDAAYINKLHAELSAVQPVVLSEDAPMPSILIL